VPRTRCDRDVVVDLRHTQGLQIPDGLAALIEDAVIKEHHLAERRNEHGAITLSDIHVVDLERSVGLRKQQRGQKEGR
jgi:hypothetical protein